MLTVLNVQGRIQMTLNYFLLDLNLRLLATTESLTSGFFSIDHRGGTGYIPSSSLRSDDDTYGVTPTGNDKEVEYFIASDARYVT